MTFALVDEASYQDPNGAEPDFVAAKKSGLVGVFIKATDGVTYVNPYFLRDAQAAHAAGLYVGAYHFEEPRDDAAQQGQFFLDTVAKLPAGVLQLRHALDHETTQGCSTAQVSQCGAGWLRFVQNHVGWQPLVYTYPNFAQSGYCQGLGGYPLWLASYSSTHVAPGPWSKYVLLQTGQAPEAGFSGGPVDQDQTPDLAPLLIPGASPASAPVTNPEDDMLFVRDPSNGGEYAVDLDPKGNWVVRHLSGPEAGVVASNGRKIPDATPDQLKALGIS